MDINIEKLNKDISLESFIVSCKIPGIGPVVAKKIADKVKNATTLRDLLEEGKIDDVLYEITGLGKTGITSIIEKLSNLDFMLILEDLQDQGFDMFKDTYIYAPFELMDNYIEKKNEEDAKGVSLDFSTDLKGYNICITGTLSMPRKYFENFIRTNNGNFQTSVTNDTNILIYSNSDGTSTSKYRKALKLQKDKGTDQVLVITEKEFLDSTKKLK